MKKLLSRFWNYAHTPDGDGLLIGLLMAASFVMMIVVAWAAATIGIN